MRNEKRQYLLVKETRNRGYSAPGGKLEKNENFYEAAVRECVEETGIEIEILGILRLENKQ